MGYMFRKLKKSSEKMKINVRLDSYGRMPTKAHDLDAGFDLYSPAMFRINKHMSYAIDTGVHFEIPKGYVGFIKSKSGLNVHNGITCEGVIDSGYTGSVVAKLYNNSDTDYVFYGGQKITQIVFLPIPDVELEEVDEFEETERGDNGFGSSGK